MATSIDEEVLKYLRNDNELSRLDKRTQLYMSTQNGVGEITSRDSIINPYDYVSVADYGFDAEGQARYNQELSRLKQIASQQEAAYQDWYNSASQVAARERAAGRNPDLIEGFLGDESASSIDGPTESPLSGIPTSEELTISALGTFTNLVGTIASLAALPSSIGAATASANASQAGAALTTAQAEAQTIANSQSIEAQMFGLISGGLADATNAAINANDSSFDPASWLANDDNVEPFFKMSAPEDSQLYRAAFSRARANVIKARSAANKQLGESVTTQNWLSDALASPYRDDNLILQNCYMRPLMEYRTKMLELKNDYDHYVLGLKKKVAEGIDVQSYIDGTNAEYKYKNDYWSNFNGDEAAAADLLLKKSEALKAQTISNVYSNYEQVYNKAPDTYLGMRAGSIILGASPLNFSEFLKVRGFTNNPYRTTTNPDVGRSPYNSTSADEWLEKSLEEGWLID